MKNILIARRKRLSPNGPGAKKEHVLKDADYFILGAISKLFATGSTYPYL
jgi:adenine nucleotide transporter 17